MVCKDEPWLPIDSSLVPAFSLLRHHQPARRGQQQHGQQTLSLKGHADRVSSVLFSPNGNRMFSGSWDNCIKVWNARNGQETLTLKGHIGRVTCLAISPDGTRLVSGSEDGAIKFWDAGGGQDQLYAQPRVN